METEKSNEEVLKKHISDIVRPIFEKVAQETPSNHRMVGNTQKSNKKIVTPSLYNPHNYRLYFSFTKENYTPKEGMVGVWFGKLKNYGKEFTAVGEGIRVIIHKTKAEIINKLSDQEWFYINRTKAKEEIQALLNKVDHKCIESFKKFIEVYGGKSDFVILKREGRPDLNLFTKSDNKVMKEPFIDSLPLEMTFETPIVKKNYKEHSVEFKTPMGAANFLENSALHEFSPEISTAFQIFNMKIDKVADSLVYIAENYKSHVKMVEQGTKVQKENLKFLKMMNNKLSQRKLKEFF